MLKNNFVGKLQAFVSWLLTNFNQSKSCVFYGQNCHGQKSDICLQWLESQAQDQGSNLSGQKVIFSSLDFLINKWGWNVFKYF